MPNEQLLAQIKGRLAQGASRSVLIQELIAAGYPVAAVNEALTQLNVPLEAMGGAGSIPVLSSFAPSAPPLAPSAPAPTPPPAPLVPATPMPTAPTMPPVLPPAVPPIAPATPPAAPAPVTRPDGRLPGVMALFKSSWATYRARLGALLAVVLVQVLVMLACGLLVVAAIIGGASFLVLGSLASNYLLMGAIVVGALLVLCLFVWLVCWCVLAEWQVIRGASERLGLGAAFGRSRSQTWAFIRMSLLSGAAFLGSLILFAALPTALLFYVIGGLAIPSMPTVIGLGVLAFAIFTVIAFLFMTWFGLGGWVVVDDKARGADALLISKQLAAGRFWAVLGRWLGLFGLMLLASIVVSILASIIGALAGSSSVIVGGVVRALCSLFLIYPVFFAANYALYSSLMAREGVATAPARGKPVLIALAILGLLGILADPAAGLSVASQWSATRSADKTVILDFHLSSLQIDAEVYQSTNANYGPPSESCSSGMFATDPKLSEDIQTLAIDAGAAPICNSSGTAYAVYAGGHCVDSTGAHGASAALLPGATACTLTATAQ